MLNQILTAFPFTNGNLTCTGMTLRDYFAAKAMHSLNSRPDYDDVPAEVIALEAYELADLMIKVRVKP